MRISREFVVEEHEEYGGLGLRPLWMADADPISAVAHDMLEHTANDNGSVEAEFMALGAVLWGRGACGWFSRRGGQSDPGRNIGADIPELANHVAFEGFTLDNPGRTRALDADLEEYISTAINVGNADTRAVETPELNADYMRGWMRRGYRAAARRYRGIDNYTVCQAFDAADKTAADILAHAVEGSRVRITVDVDAARAWYDEIFDD